VTVLSISFPVNKLFSICVSDRFIDNKYLITISNKTEHQRQKKKQKVPTREEKKEASEKHSTKRRSLNTLEVISNG
jgi:hypothetical protein